MDLSPEKLSAQLADELRELLDDATPGPWRFEDHVKDDGSEDYSRVVNVADPEILGPDGEYVGQTAYDDLSSTTRNSIADGELIVWLRNHAETFEAMLRE